MTKNTSSALYFTGMICLTVACCLIGWLVNQRDQRALQYAQLAAQVDGGSVDTNESTVAQQPEHTTTTATTDTATKKPTTSTYTLQKDEYPILLMRACGVTNEARALKNIKELNQEITDWTKPTSFKVGQKFIVPCNLKHSMVLAVQPKRKATAKAKA